MPDAKRRVLCVFGTRPEAIKMALLSKALRAHPDFEAEVCVTAQHRSMLDQVLAIFDVKPRFDLDLMKDNQGLSDITARIVTGMTTVIRAWRPDWVLVQGDTTTAFGGALAAFYEKVAVGHVEAGLRTGFKYSPWPEEMNRALVGRSPISTCRRPSARRKRCAGRTSPRIASRLSCHSVYHQRKRGMIVDRLHIENHQRDLRAREVGRSNVDARDETMTGPRCL